MMVWVKHQRPETGEPPSWLSKHRRPVSVGAILTVIGMLIGAGFLVRPTDYVRADVQKLRDEGQDKEIAGHERRISVIENRFVDALEEIRDRLPEPKKGKR